jgi:hypothetical protein
MIPCHSQQSSLFTYPDSFRRSFVGGAQALDEMVDVPFKSTHAGEAARLCWFRSGPSTLSMRLITSAQTHALSSPPTRFAFARPPRAATGADREGSWWAHTGGGGKTPDATR